MIALWISAALASGHATLSAHAVLGQEVIVSVVDDDQAAVPGQTLTVIHHPGSPDEREVGIGITDSLGRVRWKPDQGGVAVLRLGDDDALRFDVSTPYPSPSALVPLALAALGALGALLRGWRS